MAKKHDKPGSGGKVVVLDGLSDLSLELSPVRLKQLLSQQGGPRPEVLTQTTRDMRWDLKSNLD